MLRARIADRRSHAGDHATNDSAVIGPKNKRLCIPLGTGARRVDVDLERQISAALPMMNAEITTKKIGSKWHGYIVGRPDLDEAALSEEAARRKMEQLRDRIGT